MKINKKEANRKLESAVMNNNAFLVSVAFSEGASIGYKYGNFFVTACYSCNVEIVEMFVLNHNFVKKANYYQKQSIDQTFHKGFSYAISSGKIDVVKFLNESPTYQKLKKLDGFIVNGLELAARNNHLVVVDYILKNTCVMESEEFKNNNFSQETKDYMKPIISLIKLKEITSVFKNVMPEKLKIKI